MAALIKYWTRYNTDGTMENYGRKSLNYNQAGELLGVDGVHEIDIQSRIMIGANKQRSLIYMREDPNLTLPLNPMFNILVEQGMSTKNYNRRYYNTWGPFNFRGDIIVGTKNAQE